MLKDERFLPAAFLSMSIRFLDRRCLVYWFVPVLSHASFSCLQDFSLYERLGTLGSGILYCMRRHLGTGT